MIDRYETRLYLEYSKDHFVREWSYKEGTAEEVKEAFGEMFPAKCRDGNAVGEILKEKELDYETIKID